MPATEPAIEFDGVAFGYRSAAPPVLERLDLQVAAGEAVALVGRSGAGKSTLLRLVNGLAKPSSGEVRIEGRSTGTWDGIALRRRIGYVLQEVGLFPHMTVARNIGLLAQVEGWPAPRVAARVDELFGLVNLPRSYASRWPDELSGGERQRAGVARALCLDPPLLLMDEPFGALDPVTRLDLHGELRRIQSRVHKTILVVTHDLREALALGSRVGVLDGGRLVVLGGRDALGESDHPFVRALLATLDERADAPS